MNFEKSFEISMLFNFYSKLLTEKQQNIVKLYCDKNLSLGEIAEQLGITRQAVKCGLDSAMASLQHYEEKLGLKARYYFVKDMLDKEKDVTTKKKLSKILEEM